jgi:hypothetical protein
MWIVMGLNFGGLLMWAVASLVYDAPLFESFRLLAFDTIRLVLLVAWLRVGYVAVDWLRAVVRASAFTVPGTGAEHPPVQPSHGRGTELLALVAFAAITTAVIKFVPILLFGAG